MNAYRAYDRIEDGRWVEQQLIEEKEKWIDGRAKEIIAVAPDKPMQFASWSVNSKLRLALGHEKSIEAYNDYISAVAYAQAEYDWDHRTGCPF
ncbi:host nuclease inhibitor GamL [Citrobacter freundii]|nr:host nuclease inhibitor GamL [Citrobacter freundii]